MRRYLFDLIQLVVIAFLTPLVGAMVAANPFNLIEFDWSAALVTSGSAAVLALLTGVLARFQGDPETARFGRR